MNNHFSSEIPPNSEDIIVNINVPDGYVLFVKGWAFTWSPDTKYIVYVDGEKFDEIDSPVGSFENPQRFNKEDYILVRYNLRIVGVNNSDSQKPFEVLILADFYDERAWIDYYKSLLKGNKA